MQTGVNKTPLLLILINHCAINVFLQKLHTYPEMSHFSGIYADAQRVKKGIKSSIYYQFVCAYCRKHIPVVRTSNVHFRRV